MEEQEDAPFIEQKPSVDVRAVERAEPPKKTYSALVGYGLCINYIIGTGVFRY